MINNQFRAAAQRADRRAGKTTTLPGMGMDRKKCICRLLATGDRSIIFADFDRLTLSSYGNVFMIPARSGIHYVIEGKNKNKIYWRPINCKKGNFLYTLHVWLWPRILKCEHQTFRSILQSLSLLPIHFCA